MDGLRWITGSADVIGSQIASENRPYHKFAPSVRIRATADYIQTPRSQPPAPSPWRRLLMRMTRCSHTRFFSENCLGRMYDGQGGVCLRGDAPARKSMLQVLPSAASTVPNFVPTPCLSHPFGSDTGSGATRSKPA